MNRLTFRTTFGGPAVSPEYSAELARIKEALEDVEFQYDFDMSMNVGGDMIVITDPTGVRSVRITPAKHLAKGLIQLNSEDVLSAKEPAKFLRGSIYAAMTEMLDRVAKKDPDFDIEAEKAKLSFLQA